MRLDIIKVSKTSLLLGLEVEKKVGRSKDLLAFDLFPYFLRSLVVDSELKQGP